MRRHLKSYARLLSIASLTFCEWRRAASSLPRSKGTSRLSALVFCFLVALYSSRAPAAESGKPSHLAVCVYGVLSIDDEPDPGRSGIPTNQLQIRMLHYGTSGCSRENSAFKNYLPLTWSALRDAASRAEPGGTSPYKKLVGRRVKIFGILYKKCESGGFYLRDESDSDDNCFMHSNFEHIEILDSKGKPLRRIR